MRVGGKVVQRVELTERLPVLCCPYWGSSLCEWTMQSLLGPSFGQLPPLWTFFLFFFFCIPLLSRFPPDSPLLRFHLSLTDLSKQKCVWMLVLSVWPADFIYVTYSRSFARHKFSVEICHSRKSTGVTNHGNDGFLQRAVSQQSLLLITPVLDKSVCPQWQRSIHIDTFLCWYYVKHYWTLCKMTANHLIIYTI